VRIPFNRPSFAGRELAHIAAALESGHASGDGPFTRRCHTYLEQHLPGGRALLTTSGTHALEMAALLLDLRPGDEVIVPSFTFVSTANAFVLRGAIPVFADVRPDTLNIDEERLGPLITPRTKAIVVMHYAGVGCEMDAIGSIAAARGIAVVEDNAHGLFGRYRQKPLGTFGSLSALSFHETKNITCGEGGALVLNDHRFFERAELIREKGTDRSRFFRGEVDKYTWVDVGSSYLPSDILAAFLCAQFEALSEIQSRRRRIWEAYQAGLSEWASATGVRLPIIPAHCEQPFHLFYLLLPSETARARLIAHLAGRGILAVSHYVPLHLSPMGQRFGARAGACPVTEDVSARLLRLPFFTGLEGSDQEDVLTAIRAWHP
jgi:dTDP-4-amino-4,6-dideoxygalactose transaminase